MALLAAAYLEAHTTPRCGTFPIHRESSAEEIGPIRYFAAWYGRCLGPSMLRWTIKKKLASEEKKLGASLDYVRHILDTSRRAFFAFARCLHLAEYRKAAPVEVLAVAGIAASKARDCGECVQIAINQSKKEGIPNGTLSAALAGDRDALPEDLRAVHDLARAVLNGDDEAAHPLREQVRAKYGEATLIEIAYALAMGQFFPTIKRTLGYAESCAINPPKI